MSLNASFQALKDNLKLSEKMPLVFLGHGSPMNAIEDNQYTKSWKELGKALPTPQAILVISAHWMTRKTTLVDVSAVPRTIHDFYGFPTELNEMQYPANGAPALAADVAQILRKFDAHTDDSRGLDHGAWSVLNSLFPAADIPVFQLSIDMTKSLQWHLDIGKTLASLRDRGVLILGSGNVVHNLAAMRFNGVAHDWAMEFDHLFADKLSAGDFHTLTDADALGSLFNIANPTPEHYLPALSVAGASLPKDELYFTTDGIDLGSLSMRSFVYHGA